MKSTTPKKQKAPARKTSRKVKKSFTLSSKAFEYLRRVQRDRHARSASQALEDILEAARKIEERAKFEKLTIAYYDSLTGEDLAEDRAWAELGSQALAATGPFEK